MLTLITLLTIILDDSKLADARKETQAIIGAMRDLSKDFTAMREAIVAQSDKINSFSMYT